MTYSISTNGDALERHLYPSVIQPHFPSYEEFWVKFVVPLTNRPGDTQLKTNAALAQIGKGESDLCLAQLHYTVLRQLGRCQNLLAAPAFTQDHLVFAFSSIVGAQDCAFELLERFHAPMAYGPWLDKRRGGVNGGREVQSAWKQSNNYPLQNIRDYRNNVVHGRTLPGIVFSQGLLVPKIGKETNYFDWRLITAVATLPVQDFDTPLNIVNQAYLATLQYLEAAWRKNLLPHI